MFGLIAVILLILSFLFHGFGFTGNAWVDSVSFLYAGLACLALHLLGAGAGWHPWRKG